MESKSICKFIVSGLLMIAPLLCGAQKVCDKQPWSVRMATSEMMRCPESWQLDFQTRLKWDYCHGLELQSMLDVYDAYGDKKFFDYAVAYADTMIHADGSIETYKLHEYNIDRLNSGKMLFRIYEQTKDEKYRKALDLLRSQLDTHPRNADGGFWHKKIYEHQMWLDGLYMGQPQRDTPLLPLAGIDFVFQARHRGERPFRQAQNHTDRILRRILHQMISALRSSDALHISRLIQYGDDLFQILFRNLLPCRNILNSDRITRVINRQIQHQSQRIPAFCGNFHPLPSLPVSKNACTISSVFLSC